jgi:hypothetical protein
LLQRWSRRVGSPEFFIRITGTIRGRVGFAIQLTNKTSESVPIIPMSWITVVWSMNAAGCLTLAGFYCLVWCKQRETWVYLLFSSSAVAAAAIAAFELGMMHAETVGRYEALVRWVHVPTWVLIVSFVIFVRLYLHAGRRLPLGCFNL